MLTVWLSRVRSLSIIIEDVKVIIPQRDLTDEQQKDLRSIVQGCHNVLNTLKETLKKYQELGASNKYSHVKGSSLNFQRAWKRLRWEPEDIKELRSRITSNITLLNAFNGRLIR
jgi:hypothetical protein